MSYRLTARAVTALSPFTPLALAAVPALAAPVASITAPTPARCVCPGDLLTITGTSRDTVPAEYAGDTLEYSTTPGAGPWITIGSNPGTTPVTNGPLYFWNTNGLPAGTYFLRLTVRGAAASATALTSVTLSGTANPAPQFLGFSPFEVFSQRLTLTASGGVSCEGIVLPAIQYRTPGGDWTTTAITPRSSFVAADIDLAPFPNGPLEVRAVVRNVCGTEQITESLITVDRRPVTAAISAPAPAAFIRGFAPVVGDALSPTLESWTLDFAASAGPWQTIATGTTPVANNFLGLFAASSLTPGPYTLRLRVVSSVRTHPGGPNVVAETFRTINVGCRADVNLDNQVSVQDVFDFLSNWFAPCF